MTALIALVPDAAGNPDDATRVPTVFRFKENPIIRPAMLGKDGGNINGPSLIKVPDWLPNPLGQYYLYFAHHRGAYIRLAYADRLQGPWTIHGPGTLHLKEVHLVKDAEANKFGGHIASPDVHVDHEKKEIRMYFHSTVWGHLSSVAISKDGIQFKTLAGAIGGPYFRVFRWNGDFYAIDRAGMVLKSPDGLKDFKRYEQLKKTIGNIRHSAVKLDGNLLSVYFSRVGDSPESIMLSRVELLPDGKPWKISAPVKVMEPEMDYEGAELPVRPSSGGLVNGMVRQLRDPAVYREGDRTYLLYSVAGEHGIGIAELKE
jgi:hypothetical protein